MGDGESLRSTLMHGSLGSKIMMSTMHIWNGIHQIALVAFISRRSLRNNLPIFIICVGPKMATRSTLK
jgi:hypothetical protein